MRTIRLNEKEHERLLRVLRQATDSRSYLYSQLGESLNGYEWWAICDLKTKLELAEKE